MCLQVFFARLSGDVLSLYRSPARPQQCNMNRLLHAFRTQYAPNQDVLKVKVETLRQKPGQTIPAFFREVQGVARNAHPIKTVPNQILLTTFVAAFSNPTVRWEVRKAKLEDTGAALQAVVELHSSLEINGFKLETSGVNKISAETLSTLSLSWFVVSAQKFKTLWLSHHVPTELLPKKIIEIARSVQKKRRSVCLTRTKTQ